MQSHGKSEKPWNNPKHCCTTKPKDFFFSQFKGYEIEMRHKSLRLLYSSAYSFHQLVAVKHLYCFRCYWEYSEKLKKIPYETYCIVERETDSLSLSFSKYIASYIYGLGKNKQDKEVENRDRQW